MKAGHKLGIASLFLAAMISTEASAQVVVQTLKSLGTPGLSGATPQAPLCMDSDGWLYGTTTGGGSNGIGVVFKIRPDGTSYTVIHSFNGLAGQSPQGGLLIGSDGILYGTTPGGGSINLGTVFKLNRDGTGFGVLHNFAGFGVDGALPQAALLQAGDGWLYGSTQYGGSNNCGTIFKVSTNGLGYSGVHDFSGPDGQAPYGKLLQGLDGALYGTTYQGGISNLGTIFKINPDGNGHTVLHGFTKTRVGSPYDGFNPKAGLVQALDGTLYGTTESGGGSAKNQFGTVFKINPDGSGMAIVASFTSTGWPYGHNPRCELVLSGDGTTLFGTTSTSLGGGGIVFIVNTDGSNFNPLHGFDTSGNGGTYPSGGVVQDSEGNLFGVTSQGGSNGVGIVFKVVPSPLPTYSEFDMLYSFTPSGGDANYPLGKLVQDSNGIIYGVASAGGTNGCGALFKINPDGSGYSILKTYSGPDGKSPRAIMLNTDGLLYGTTAGGGISNCGTVFKTSRDASSYTVLHSFDGLGGSDPEAGVMLATNGVLYGTTYGGGTGFFGSSDGTIFRINTDGTGFLKLHDFNHGSGVDGDAPTSGFVQGVDGVLYSGTTKSSYPYQPGTVYKINLDGSGFTVLKFFYDVGGLTAGPCTDFFQGSDQALYGATVRGIIFKINPDGSGYTELHTLEANNWAYRPTYPTLGDDGMIYGSDYVGGNYAGTIYKMTADGSNFTTLYIFGSVAGEGTAPLGPLMRGSDGLWYGTTSTGGNMNCGTIFRMVPRPQITSSARLPGGAFQFSFSSVSNFVYRVETSTNTLDWVPLANLTATGNQTAITDLSASSFPQRYYRAVWVQ